MVARQVLTTPKRTARRPRRPDDPAMWCAGRSLSQSATSACTFASSPCTTLACLSAPFLSVGRYAVTAAKPKNVRALRKRCDDG